MVGFIGRRRPSIATHLINRILDSHVFGNNLDTNLISDKQEDWFKWRRISYFHQRQMGILFLHFSSVLCPGFDDGFGSAMEDDHDFGDLQGLLFMFSVQI
ncbi:uncharacterized protein LOC21408090 isoform X2 [Morus notabilis]|uniref:uncharacterized protein LOC21408090 isoform X2 n=1 Tax=Morus notabilis TaxID=981085 RepID=UPI000CED582A|nr:uncharacterized protein LOC21408090 isoform X2 [Morus notabilis]